MKELLMGAGSSTQKRIGTPGHLDWGGLVTLDYNADHNPDVVHDLNVHPLPFEDNEFDEVHAYEVLEHLGSLGDYKFFFAEFSEYWRILKPGGLFCATVPAITSPWLFGDPSHTRVIMGEQLVFLDQQNYEQVGFTPMSDFRSIYKANFRTGLCKVEDQTLKFALKAIKG